MIMIKEKDAAITEQASGQRLATGCAYSRGIQNENEEGGGRSDGGDND